jgi:hypothetical protein
MVMETEIDFVGSVAEVAVRVTRPLDGMTVGAVYTVLAPLPVVVGLKEPQTLEPQATLQVTSGFAEVSFVIIATKGDVAPTCSDAGGCVKRFTTMGIGDTIVTVAETVLLGSATELAVIFTVEPLGIASGAVYVTPAAFALGPNEPQAALAH